MLQGLHSKSNSFRILMVKNIRERERQKITLENKFVGFNDVMRSTPATNEHSFHEFAFSVSCLYFDRKSDTNCQGVK